MTTKNPETSTVAEYDYLVVGAGSSGCVLANRLSSGGKRVLLLEAGPADRRRSIRVPAALTRLQHTELDWEYVTEPQTHLEGRRIKVPRGRVLGGSSSINAQVYLRGHRADYDHWARLGNEGWGYDDVLPYFERAERVGSDSGPGTRSESGLSITPLRDPHPATDAFIAAAVEAGMRRNDQLHEDLEGVGRVYVTQHRGARWSTADAYVRPALERPNLQLVTESRVTRVLFEGQRAVGVEYRHHASVARARAHEVILSGGVINSPQLLLLSGVGPGDQLRWHGIDVVQDLPGVGRNLQDHVHVPLGLTLERLPPAVIESAASSLRYALTKRGRLASNQSEAAAFVKTDPELDAPDLELLLAAPELQPLYLTPRWAAARLRDRALVLTGRRRRSLPRMLAISPVVIQPQSTGSLELRSTDPLDSVRIDPNYLSDRRDVDLLVAGFRLARRIAATTPLSDHVDAELIPGPRVQTDGEIEAFVRARARSLQHLAGTCKMGSDDLAVVDPCLRVRGIEGLRVVDASVLPNITRGHLNAPAVMIAERAADMISSRADSPPAATSPY